MKELMNSKPPHPTSFWFMEFRARSFATVIIATMVSVLSTGCGAYHSLPANWEQSLPGFYEGNLGSLRETIEFKTDGSFTHEVFSDQRRLVSESGKWSVKAGVFDVELDRFTQFFNPMTGRFSETGAPFVSYIYWPLPDGETFNKISADVEYAFTLTRKEKRP